MEQRKKPEVNIDKQRPLFLTIGLVVVLSICLLAFEWRSFEEKIINIFTEQPDEIVEEQILDASYQPPPPPPPPPPTVVEIIEIVDNSTKVEPVNFTEETDENTETNNTDFSSETTESLSDDNTVYNFAEQYPVFPGCNEDDADKNRECFDKQLRNYLSKNLHYPQIAKEMGVTGKVWVQFVIEKDGNVSSVQVLRGIGYQCDDEAVRVISKLPQMKPAKQRGRPVRLGFKIPINFSLD